MPHHALNCFAINRIVGYNRQPLTGLLTSLPYLTKGDIVGMGKSRQGFHNLSPLSTGPVRDPGDGGYQAFTRPANPIGIAQPSDEIGLSLGNPDGIGWCGCSVTRHPQADTWL